MRFSIRDLLLATIIVALGVGWWLDRSKLATAKQEMEARWDATLANERRMANLRALEAWGRVDGSGRTARSPGGRMMTLP